MNLRKYDEYVFIGKDYIECVIIVLVMTGVISYLFYDTGKAAIIGIPIAFAQYRSLKRKKVKQQKKQLCKQFQSLMEALVTSLTAGYSLEQSFCMAQKDLRLIYEKEAVIFEELDRIIYGIERNMPVDELLRDFGERSRLEDIQNFANVVGAAKRNGGNLIRIMQKTVNSISDKMSVENEIETMIASKKLEERIMMIMPYGILAYLRVSNGDFLMVLYHNAIGTLLMTIFLVLIYVAGKWAEHIMEISV